MRAPKSFCALAAVVVLILAAPPARAQVSGGVVKIGDLGDTAGVYSDISGKAAIEAARLAIEDFGGTVLGAPIELVTADHQNKADVAATKAREWYDNEGVDAIVDLVTSSAALAVYEVARQAQKIAIVSGAATSRLTNEDCSPFGIHWTYDTYALATGTAKAVLEEGGDSWFFVTVDYAYGHSLEEDVRRVLAAGGGTVLGNVLTPFPTADFSSYLLQAQASGAKVVAFANAGQDTINSIKQAKEFGLAAMGQQLVGLLVFLSDAHALGTETAQGLLLTTGYYWDMDDDTRAFAERIFARTGVMPTMNHAGIYSSILHYLRAVEAAGTDDAQAVMAKMREMPVDFFGQRGYLREDGRTVHDMYLARVKTPQRSTGEWDLYDILRTIPGDQAFRPLSESRCPLVRH